MQDRPSGTLPRNLLINEIDELGRALAPLIQPGSPIERSRRREVRALLRDAFLATQEDRTMDELRAAVAALKELHGAFFGGDGNGLAQRLGDRRSFGAVDEHMAKLGSFFGPTERAADELAETIQARVERTLGALKREDETEDRGATRPMRAPSEMRELITKKI